MDDLCPAAAERQALEILDRHIRETQPIAVFALFSGGHDSLCSTHVAAKHPAFSGVLHINTGIGIEETRLFVRNTCREFGWPLHEYQAAQNRNGKGLPDPQVYADLVAAQGFPGPPMHTKMYNRLKQRPLRMFLRD